MNKTEQTLIEQMRITEFDIENRKALISFYQDDFDRLKSMKSTIEVRIDALVAQFYKKQTEIPEIALLIGDADTLARLMSAQRNYVLDLFSGIYDLEYVNNRLRIGLVHKRIGVEPKLYLSAIYTMKELLIEMIGEEVEDILARREILTSLDKLFFFDVTLVFETYIRSLVSEIESAKEKSDRYATVLEDKVRERTEQLEEMSRVDSLTGLLNVRHLNEILTPTLRACQRRSEILSMVYIDINDFKIVNDTKGHLFGDEILRVVSGAIKKVSRIEDSCFRYGGDEFCIVLPKCTKEQAKDMYLDRLNRELKKTGKNISISVGIVETGPKKYMTPDAIIRAADERMYIEKSKMKSETTSNDSNPVEEIEEEKVINLNN